jgi:hypothetical protein
VSTFLKFADGLGLPPAARRALRIDSAGLSPLPAPRTAAGPVASYPGSPAEAMQNASELWLADLNDPAALQRGTARRRRPARRHRLGNSAEFVRSDFFVSLVPRTPYHRQHQRGPRHSDQPLPHHPPRS